MTPKNLAGLGSGGSSDWICSHPGCTRRKLLSPDFSAGLIHLRQSGITQFYLICDTCAGRGVYFSGKYDGQIGVRGSKIYEIGVRTLADGAKKTFSVLSQVKESLLTRSVGAGVIPDMPVKESSEASCVCSSYDVFNIGCPSARGERCRSL